MTVLLILFLVVELIAGALFCFFGCRYFRAILACAGFLVGSLCSLVLLLPVLNVWLAIFLALLIGLAIGSLSYFLYVVGLFLCGAMFGMLVGGLLLTLFSLGSATIAGILIMIVLALAGGIAAIVFRRFFIALSTSFSGATTLTASAAVLILHFNELSMATGSTLSQVSARLQSLTSAAYAGHTLVLGLISAAIGVAGLLVQLLKTAPKHAGKGSKYGI